jgi:hypothetical protein
LLEGSEGTSWAASSMIAAVHARMPLVGRMQTSPRTALRMEDLPLPVSPFRQSRVFYSLIQPETWSTCKLTSKATLKPDPSIHSLGQQQWVQMLTTFERGIWQGCLLQWRRPSSSPTLVHRHLRPLWNRSVSRVAKRCRESESHMHLPLTI